MTEPIEIANLVLGIIGTITGSLAMFVHYWRLRRENPRLAIEVSKCEHDFALSTYQIRTISFWAKFQIKNQGDRGTRINDIGLVFSVDGKECRLKKQYFHGQGRETESRWIEAHDIEDIEADFWEAFEGSEKERIDCTFTIYHTHGAEEVEAVSIKRTARVVET
jgi:hypothetical protein